METWPHFYKHLQDSRASFKSFSLRWVGTLPSSPNKRGNCGERHCSTSAALEVVGKDYPVGLTVPKSRHAPVHKALKFYSRALQKCSLNCSLRHGQTIHGRLIRSCLDPDSHLWTCLIDMYAKCDSLFSARQLLVKMTQPDALTSGKALITRLVTEGNNEEGVWLFFEMRREGISPDGFLSATILKVCSTQSALFFGEQMHGQVIKYGLSSFLYVASALVDVYAKCNAVELAQEVFDCMDQRTPVCWSALFTGYARAGIGDRVLELFSQITDLHVRACKFTISNVIKACAELGDAREARYIHSLAFKTVSRHNDFIACNLIDMYSKCGLVEDAYKVFVEIKNPDLITWTTIVSCFDRSGCTVEAAKAFGVMRKMGVCPNEFTLCSILRASADIQDFRYGESIHAYVLRTGFINDGSVAGTLGTMYVKNGFNQDGFRVFTTLADKDFLSWNVLFSGFHYGSDCQNVFRFFKGMLLEGLKPDRQTFLGLLRSCMTVPLAHYIIQIHSCVIKNNLDRDVYVGTALFELYMKCGIFYDAQHVFARLWERDVVTWNGLIAGYACINKGKWSLCFFAQMQKEGIKSNEFTFASCLSACSTAASLESGCQIHSLIVKSGYLSDAFVASALIDMYQKCGCLKEFEAVSDCLINNDVALWNSVICAYSQHRAGGKALKAFQEMLYKGIFPDDISFIGVLSACGHLGLVQEGLRHFESMSKIFGIVPRIEHYACIVAILGRAGKFNEIEQFILKMPLVPNSLIWETVLGACSMHHNIELGERAAVELFTLNQHTDSTYILLSNIYASNGRWDDVARVRMMMQARDVRKESSCSYIKADGQVHVFCNQDGSHVKVHEIYGQLEELHEKIISFQFAPNGYWSDKGDITYDEMMDCCLTQEK